MDQSPEAVFPSFGTVRFKEEETKRRKLGPPVWTYLRSAKRADSIGKMVGALWEGTLNKQPPYTPYITWLFIGAHIPFLKGL